MSPIAWAIRPFQKYADFSGRAPRAEFWWFFLFLMILYFVLTFVFIGAMTGLATSQPGNPLGAIGALGVGGIIMLLIWLALLIPTIAVQTRRLHDTNRSGWWIGGFYLLYALYFVVAMGTAFSGADGTDPSQGIAPVAGVAVIAMAFFVYMIVLLIFFCLRGTRGPNRFGPDPYGQDVEQVFA